jgi:integrase
VNLKLAALSSFYSYVKDHPYRAPDGRDIYLWPADIPNPWRAVERPKSVSLNRSRRLTIEDAVAICATINTDCISGIRDFALITTYLTTCVRFDGLISARWGDIQPLPNGKYVLGYRYKGGAHREAVLDKLNYQAICAYLKAVGRLDDIQAGDYIFTPLFPYRAAHLGHKVAPNRPISSGTANGMLKKYARIAGVDVQRAHIHGLRRAGSARRYKDQKVNGAVDPMVLQKILGHTKLESTIRYIQEELEELEDPGGDQAARFWLKKRKRKRKKTDDRRRRL